MVPSCLSFWHLVAGFAVLAVCGVIQPRPLFAAGLADGDWIAKESCGENKAGKDEAAKKPFSWDIELAVKAGHISGSKHSINPDNKAVTDITYQGTVKDSSIHIIGNGKRSNLPQPWTYAYEGTFSSKSGAQVSGDMTMRLPNGQQFKLRFCTLSFLTLKIRRWHYAQFSRLD
jgi:hypothetical protein